MTYKVSTYSQQKVHIRIYIACKKNTVIYFLLQLSGSNEAGPDVLIRRYRLENGNSLGEKDEVRIVLILIVFLFFSTTLLEERAFGR